MKMRVNWSEEKGLYVLDSRHYRVETRKLSTMREKLTDMLGNVELVVSQASCPICGSEITYDEFTDDLSVREFEISGMCQSCQDMFFDEEENDG